MKVLVTEDLPNRITAVLRDVCGAPPVALTELTYDAPCDMPTLFERLHARSKRTVAYAMHEPWLDVGEPSDLAKANGQITTPRTAGSDR